MTSSTTPTPRTITSPTYSSLLSDLKTIITSSNKNKNHSLIENYHNIGSRISQETITKKAGYFNSILKDLSNDLEIKNSLLSRIINFQELYPNKTSINKNISWSHYRELITIKNNNLRKSLEEEIISQSLTKNDLILRIRRIKFNLKNGDNAQFDPNLLPRPNKPSYLYKAIIKQVIDGDTVIVDIDLGFECYKKQRIRLANINAKELETIEGKKAFDFLRNKAVEIEDFIVIKTNKIDIYGRYVADIFYDPFPQQNDYGLDEVFEKGNYLNQEMIDEGLAEIV